MYKSKIEQALRKTITDLGFIAPSDPLLSISEKSQFGDYSSNIALQLSKQKHKEHYQNPQEIASAIIEAFGHPKFLETVELAGPGFLNFFIKDEALAEVLGDKGDRVDMGDTGDAEVDEERKTNSGKRIIVEYCDPNTHKMLHIGHLLPLTLGETLSRLLEYQGHEVFRVNYGSDIGLSVAKCLWGIEKGEREKYQGVRGGSLREKVQFLGEAYAYAHSEYEKSLETKEEIDQITNKIYQRDPGILDLWSETKEWSLGYFETIYSIFGTLFDRRINESEVDRLGKQIVLENIGKVFIEDQGAVIFPGKNYGLHNRVFINSKGNPTYEGKEVGLALKYQEIFQSDELKLFSDKAQDDYFSVVIAANEIIFPHMKGKIRHYSFGSVGLTTGKMSSRSGNVITAEDLIDTVKLKIKQVSPGLDELSIVKLAVGAIKFAFLKYSVSSDLVYDVEESISLRGDTGPYVMYVYARIQSLLKKATKATKATDVTEVTEEEINRAQPSLIATAGKQSNHAINFEPGTEETELQEEKIAQESLGTKDRRDEGSQGRRIAGKKMSDGSKVESSLRISVASSLEPQEREVLRQLEYFEFIAQKAANNFQPNELVKYLLNLCKAFNLFYENQSVIGSKNEQFRLKLAAKTAESIKLGLYLLGIETVERM